MARMYEVSTPMLGRAVFEFAFVRYLESIGYHHMRAGDWAGGQTSHEFRQGDDLVALSIVPEGHRDCRIAIESDTVWRRPSGRGREREDAVAGQSPAGCLPGGPRRLEGAASGGKWKTQLTQ